MEDIITDFKRAVLLLGKEHMKKVIDREVIQYLDKKHENDPLYQRLVKKKRII